MRFHLFECTVPLHYKLYSYSECCEDENTEWVNTAKVSCSNRLAYYFSWPSCIERLRQRITAKHINPAGPLLHSDELVALESRRVLQWYCLNERTLFQFIHIYIYIVECVHEKNVTIEHICALFSSGIRDIAYLHVIRDNVCVSRISYQSFKWQLPDFCVNLRVKRSTFS